MKLLARLCLFSLLAIGTGGCVSIDQERSDIDEAMWERVSAEYGPVVAEAEPAAYVTEVGERLVEFAPANEAGPDSWTFVVLEDDAMQAFATIDGRVALTKGLVARFNSEDEMAAEMARQIAHARLQHAWGFMNNQIGSAGFFIWPKGAATKEGVHGAKVEYASWLFHRHGVGFMHPFQQWQLVEADEAAMGMLKGAGYDARAIQGPLEVSARWQDSQYGYTYGHVPARARAAEHWLDGHGGASTSGEDHSARFEAFRRAIGVPASGASDTD